MNNFIEISNLSHRFGTEAEGVLALSEVNLTVEKGEFIAIIGGNGSGKSTLARHCNALLVPTEGKVLIEGQDTTAEEVLWQIRQKVGMVFQNPDNQIVASVVEEDVAFGLENIGVPSEEIRPRVMTALHLVGMESYAQHAPHRLSGGQKQRIAIAGVVALAPKCIIFDEPTAMLDPKGRQEVMATVLKLNREEKITVLYITHKMEEALLADRVIAMDRGKIVCSGTPHEVFSKVELLHSLGLEAPLAAEIAAVLRTEGHKLPGNIITADELGEALCRL